jgi:hypothetical protein
MAQAAAAARLRARLHRCIEPAITHGYQRVPALEQRQLRTLLQRHARFLQ